MRRNESKWIEMKLSRARKYSKIESFKFEIVWRMVRLFKNVFHFMRDLNRLELIWMVYRIQRFFLWNCVIGILKFYYLKLKFKFFRFKILLLGFQNYIIRILKNASIWIFNFYYWDFKSAFILILKLYYLNFNIIWIWKFNFPDLKFYYWDFKIILFEF